jgi:hypothetical protein
MIEKSDSISLVLAAIAIPGQPPSAMRRWWCVQRPSCVKPRAEPDYQSVDIESLDIVRRRSVGVQHAARLVLRQVELDQKLGALEFTTP